MFAACLIVCGEGISLTPARDVPVLVPLRTGIYGDPPVLPQSVSSSGAHKGVTSGGE